MFFGFCVRKVRASPFQKSTKKTRWKKEFMPLFFRSKTRLSIGFQKVAQTSVCGVPPDLGLTESPFYPPRVPVYNPPQSARAQGTLELETHSNAKPCSAFANRCFDSGSLRISCGRSRQESGRDGKARRRAGPGARFVRRLDARRSSGHGAAILD